MKLLLDTGMLRKRRGSVLMVSIVMITIAGFVALSWLAFINDTANAAERDRQRMTAFYAAEAGVEQVVDFFNFHVNYRGAEPANYDAQKTHPAAYPLAHPVAPAAYALFEPYIVTYLTDDAFQPVLGADGKVIVTSFSFFQNREGTPEEVSLTSKIPSCTLDLSNQPRLVFTDVNNRELARVTSIQLVHPEDLLAAGQLPPDQRIITKVVSTARTPRGVEVVVESMITENPFLDIRSPGPIISFDTVDYAGQFNVHWGEVWAKEDILLPNNFTNKIPRYDANVDYSSRDNLDRWFRFRTEGWFRNANGTLYADGRDPSGFASAAPAVGTLNYLRPFEPTTLHRDRQGRSNYVGLENMQQNQNLEFPDFKYEDWKSFVQSNGFRYFFTDTAGTIYGTETNPASPNFGRTVGKSYVDWFHIAVNAENYDDVSDMIVFIDTVPTDAAGNPAPKVNGVPVVNDTYFPRNPRTGGLMPTIKSAGQSLHTRGVYFIAANLDMTGQGNPPAWQDIPESVGGVKMPNNQPPPSTERFRIFHFGIIYSWGEIANGGNRTVYGSVLAEKGFTGNGGPETYYNFRMADGSWLNLNNSRVNRTLWNITDKDTAIPAPLEGTEG